LIEIRAEILQLAALRLTRGITLDRITEQTKISRYYLKAIEDLDLEKLPGGIYRVNFLLQYASAIDEGVAEDLRIKLSQAARKADEAQSKNGSGIARAVKENLARGAAVLFLFHAPDPVSAQSAQQTAQRKTDPRLDALRRFFQKHQCPAADLAGDFILAADVNGLDWRLLPSIAFVETTCGKFMRGQNPLGWGSGKTTFASAKAAIHYVAGRLAQSPIYAGKDIRAKLLTYNPVRKDYVSRVTEIMEEVAPGLVAWR
jgi:hypothetical protein